jgi:hypothetical protein
MSNFKHFGTTVSHQNLIHDEIKSRLNSWNICYNFLQNLLSSHLLFKSVTLKYKIIFYLLFCMGVKPGLAH